ncbi:MAG: D-Ala-D-Ala carboxypeptidase family metallohydrolase [Leptolyngbyaceae cyanobacterium]
MKAKVKSDTLFKRHPVLSSELTDADKVFVPSGSEYELQFFAAAGNQHVRLELAHAALGKQKGFTWYASEADIDIEGTGIKATLQRDTLLKQQPILSSELTDQEKAFVAAGTTLSLQSYAPAPSNHMKLTLTEAQFGNLQTDVWYAKAEDIQISGQQIRLWVNSDTVFKARPTLSSQLPAKEKVFVAKNTAFGLQSYSEVEGNYLKVHLSGTGLGEDNRTIWYTFAPDIELEGTEPNNCPEDRNPAGRVELGDRGETLNLPGFQGTFNTRDPILAGGYFTWGQATHGGTRLPTSTEVIYGMIRIAEALEEIRVLFGSRPIKVISWYRDPATNLRVGGIKTSRHITGDGVNFMVEGVHPFEVYAQLDPWWGAKGGLASASTFTHIDARGYRARWSYEL